MTEVQPEEQSLGELVASATGNVSKLVRTEMELAKLELVADAKKAALGGVMFAVAGLIGGLVVILLSIAFAYGLVAMGMWHWAAFLLVSAIYILLAGVLLLIGFLRIRKIKGAPRTRRTVADDLKMLRRGDDDVDLKKLPSGDHKG